MRGGGGVALLYTYWKETSMVSITDTYTTASEANRQNWRIEDGEPKNINGYLAPVKVRLFIFLQVEDKLLFPQIR